MDIKINDYNEPEHFRAICEDNYNISRTCEYEKNEMHHIHNSCEILFVEEGAADYFIAGKKYHVESYDILIVGPMEHHLRRIDCLPYLRYGLTIKPTYYRSIILDTDLQKVFTTPSPEMFARNYKKIEPSVFDRLVGMLCELKEEETAHKPFRSQIQRTVLIQMAVILFRAFQFKREEGGIPPSHVRMLAIKEYIDLHFEEELNLHNLSEKFFLHPSTISKDFAKYCGCTLNKYMNTVRVCEAANMLENNNRSVSEIGEICGYKSVNTFLRQFKSIMEISPLQYRKSVREWWEASKKSKQKTKQGLYVG